MSVYDFFIKSGDTQPPIEAILEDSLGPINLSGAIVRWKMRLQGTLTPLKVNALATVVAPLIGSVRYAWTQPDTDTPGIYEGEWEVTFANSSVLTFPNFRHLLVQVRAAVG